MDEISLDLPIDLAELKRSGHVALDVAKVAASNPSDFERALSFE